MFYLNLLFLFIGSWIFSYLLSLIIIKICYKFKILAFPTSDRWHKKPTALFGGISFFLTSTILILLALLFFERGAFLYSDTKSWPTPYVGLLLGSSIIFIFGIVDDILGLRPHYKVFGQILSIAVATYSGLIFSYEYMPIVLLITIFWFLGLINAFNLLDNMDGLSSGIAIVAGLLIGLHSLLQNQLIIVLICTIFVGSLLGFWVLNKRPAKIFMGDCGSQFIGFFLAAISIMGTWKDVSNVILIIFFPILILAIPIFDTTYVSIMRKIYGRKITQGGKDHLSHRLVALGFSESRAVYILMFMSFFIGLAGLTALHIFNIYWTIMIFSLVLIGFFLMAKKLSEINVYNEKVHIKDEILFIAHKARFVEIVGDILLIFVSLFLSYNLRFESNFDSFYMKQFMNIVLVVMAIKLFVFYILKVYQGDWEYISLPDLIKFVKASFVASVIVFIYIALMYRFENFSRSIIIIDLFLTILLLGGVRIAIRVFNEYLFKHRKDTIPTVLYGKNKNELNILLSQLKIKNNNKYRPMAIFCEDNNGRGSSLHGIEIISDKQKLYNVMTKHHIRDVVSPIDFDKSNIIMEFKKNGFNIDSISI